MGFGENLISLREINEISRKDLAKKLGIPYTTLRNYETNQREPGHKLLIQLAQMFSVSVDYLIGCNTSSKKETSSALPEEALKIAEEYTKLTEHGKGAVRAILNFERKELTTEDIKPMPEKIVHFPKAKKRNGMVEIKVYDQPAAAGLGNYLDDPVHHIEQYPDYVIPSKTDFGILISGDSMEPEIHNGSTAFVQACLTVDSGQIGIFILNGVSYCKKLVIDHDNHMVRLKSVNKEYDDIIVGESDDLRTVGLVLSQWTPRKFE